MPKTNRKYQVSYLLGAVLFSLDKLLLWGHRVLLICNLEMNLLIIDYDI
jgi:hypothetical protein